MLHRNTPSDCLRLPLSDTLPTQCLQLKHGYGQCKRGMIDMRKRFRGNKPVAVSTELEGGGGKESEGMMYAGKGVYEDVKGTDGREGQGLAGDAGGGEYEIYVRNDGIQDLRKK